MDTQNEITTLGEITILSENQDTCNKDPIEIVSCQRESQSTSNPEVVSFRGKQGTLKSKSEEQSQQLAVKNDSLSLSKIRQLFDQMNFSDQTLVQELISVYELAAKPNPKTGQLEVDYDTKFKVLQLIAKMRGFMTKDPEVVVNLFNSTNQRFG